MRAAVATQIDPGARLSFVHADLLKDDGWDARRSQDASSCCTSPRPSARAQSKDADDFVRPAREGRAACAACAAAKAGVKRVVMTSSCGAATPTKLGVNTVSDETVWSDPVAQKDDHYRLSKTLSEKASWEFMTSAEG